MHATFTSFQALCILSFIYIVQCSIEAKHIANVLSEFAFRRELDLGNINMYSKLENINYVFDKNK